MSSEEKNGVWVSLDEIYKHYKKKMERLYSEQKNENTDAEKAQKKD